MSYLTARELNASAPYALQEELDEVRSLSLGLTSPDYFADVVMIGCGPAVFALAMMEHRHQVPHLHIIDRDPQSFIYARLHLLAAEISPKNFERIHFIESDSAWYGHYLWPVRTRIDFLLVDGDHSYEGVKMDIQSWVRYVGTHRHVFFHDYLERPGGFNGHGEWLKGGCARAVDEAVADGRLIFEKQIGISAVCRCAQWLGDDGTGA